MTLFSVQGHSVPLSFSAYLALEKDEEIPYDFYKVLTSLIN